MSAPRVFVPGDAAAVSVGADAVAAAIADQARSRGIEITLVRNGSRGLLWLEPLVEIERGASRIGYGPVAAADVAGLFDAGWLDHAPHALRLGDIEQHPWFARQQRVTFARVGRTDPLSLDDYQASGGWAGARAAMAMTPADIVQAVTDSGLRGRGGAAFPAGIKWRTVLEAAGAHKHIVCNADEGDSGTFSDRMLMEGDPFCLIEGMLVAGLAVGAGQGWIYLRSEYPHAAGALREAITRARAAGWLGSDAGGSGRAFDIELRIGAGAYICGEETSLLNSIEGRRGEVRAKPPLPAIAGLFGQPTVVNNVITLASVPAILADGAQAYARLGEGRSRGTLPLQLAGNIARGGLFEVPFGISLRELLHEIGGGSASGRPIRAVQVGGPLGAYLDASQFDVAIDYEAFAAIGAMLGHGGIVVFDDSVDMRRQAAWAMRFCAIESCGKCTPCRIGSTRGVELIERMAAGDEPQADQALLRELCHTMTHGSLCAMGGLTPLPVLRALDRFPGDFGADAQARS